MGKRGGAAKIINTDDPNYIIDYKTRDEPGYCSVCDVLKPPGYTGTVSGFDDDPRASVCLLIHRSTNTVHAACTVIEDTARNIKEIYNFIKWTSAPKGVGSLILKSLIQFHRGTQTVLWVGVAAKADNSHTKLIGSVYSPVGFYFPSFFPTYSVTDTVTPLGRSFGFQFFSGYWSEAIETVTRNIAGPVTMKIDNSIPAIRDVRATFFEKGYEEGGWLIPNKNMMLELIGPKSRAGADQCSLQFPPIPEVPAGRILVAFHTHPRACHERYDMFLGFPSALDYNDLLVNTNGRTYDASVVFTAEGVFVCQVHPFIASMMNSENGPSRQWMVNTIAGISSHIREMFSYI